MGALLWQKISPTPAIQSENLYKLTLIYENFKSIIYVITKCGTTV